MKKKPTTTDGTYLRLTDALDRWAAENGDKVLYRFLDAAGREQQTLTYDGLRRRALALAERLRCDAEPGDRALLLFPPGLEFVLSFFACLYAGVVAVPAYPPGSRRTLPRVRAIAEDAAPRLALTDEAHLEKLELLAGRAPELAGVRWHAVSCAAAPAAAPAAPPAKVVEADDLAFLQYTSGSTATPKGVMVTHRNLVHNEEMIRRAFGLSSESVIVGWLPMYHDMGLIGNVLQPLYTGASCVLMSPVDFLRKPLRWLEAIDRYRGTTSGAPNFAYELCVRRIGEDERLALDLSSWTLAYNGAEPVRADTLERFARAFASSGFDARAFYPCYGLAEATLFVTGGERAAPPSVDSVDPAALEAHRLEPLAAADGGRRLVGCGHAWLGQRLVIADPESHRSLEEGRVGEIWLAGDSVAAGYWRRPEATAESFGARLADDPEAGPFLRTGDLGVLADGELHVTGRLKDLIILRGRNHYPQDLELTAERAHPALRPGCGAAFAVEHGGEERLVLVQELERRPGRLDHEQVIAAVRAAVARDHEVTPWDVVLLKWGSIPKTSSGKIQRRACRALYLADELAAVAHDALPGGADPRQERELDRAELAALDPEARRRLLAEALEARLARVLRRSGEIDPAAPLVALGLDSLAAVELQHGLEEELGVGVPMARLLEDATLEGLVETLLAALAAPADASAPALVPRAGGEPRVSEGQRALWLIQRTNPESSAYLLRAAARVEGEIDGDALRQAFALLVGRHEALRTVFPARAGEPVARRLDEVAQAIDLRIEAARGRGENELLEEMDREARRPMDIERGPLLRVVLYRRAEDDHRLLLVVHHLIADFWSAGLMLEELGVLYRRALGEDVPLPPAPALAYADFAAWQAERLEPGRVTALLEHWQQALPRPLPELALPTDRPRPPVLSDAGGAVAGDLDAELVAALEELARGRGTTLFVALLAAWSALLHRLSDKQQVLVGTPTAGREAAELADLVGYFVNPVVLAADLGGAPSFRDLLDRLKRVALDAFAHGELPFARLAERLQPLRDPSRSPVFQALFTLQQAHRPELAPLAPFVLGRDGARLPLGPLMLSRVQLPEQPSQMDLSLVAARVGGGVGLSLTYSRDLFDEITAERMMRRLLTLVQGALDDPDAPVRRLPLLRESQRRQLLAEWNDTEAPLPDNALVHRLFEDSADRFGAREAFSFESETLTYGELERRANRLAHHLLALGVRTETPVAVLLERGPGIPEALLAVLKARGAYVPLDPAYPAERVRMMLADSGAAVLVTGAALAADLDGFAGRVVRLDADREAIERRSSRRPRLPLSDRSLAYTIYTSGSTGRPKGVQVPHRGLVSFLASMTERPGLGAHDVLVSVTTLSFDIFALELFLPLAVGAHVVMASRRVAAAGGELLALIRERGATAMQATPTTWRLLLEAGWEGAPPLKVLCGGEPLPLELARSLARHAPSAWNLYGPTETTVWSAVHRLDRDEQRVPVGRPIANTRIVLLDRHLEPVPKGVPGQVFIGGVGVARGYLDRPALTAERFLPDGSGGEAEGVTPGSRLYATGDLARLGRGEVLEFLGRLDHQVKVRGHRIELGEIETALVAHPAIEQAVVAARTTRSGDDRLVAYLVPEEGEREDPVFELAALRAFLAATLPEVFLPSAVVVLAEMPLTPNGKVDRKALPAPSSGGAADAAERPSSELERVVAEVWSEELEVDAVGLDDNFFDLGGHSLLVSRVHARLEALTGTEIAMVELFRHTTVRALARHLGGDAARPQVLAAGAAAPAADASGAVAVIGMAGRFPGAADVDELWRRLAAGEELLKRFEDDELRAAGVAEELLERPDYVKVSGVLDDADRFDADFFGVTPREAELMDPQHRLFLELAWHGLEHAGYDPRRAGSTGVFAGVGVHTYIHQAGVIDDASTAARYQIFIGNDKDFVPTRVAYKLGLEGPAINVQTACSSSLVALHLACRSLAAGECEMALAGGVTVRTPLVEGYLWEEGGIPSPDGRCRPFDAAAQGTVFGSGGALVVLKPLARALADGDTVHAVIRGTAINNDGADKIGYTAPSVDGQAKVIERALAAAGVSADGVGYVEAHGTGTSLGDPIEVAALAQAFRAAGGDGLAAGSVALGSVKSNLGHLDTAAGITGLIKAIGSLARREIFPSLHFESPNPKLGLESTPFAVAAERRDWEAPEGRPRRAGVSSFGIGGTNAHVVVEEAPEPAPASPAPRWQLLPLAARSSTALAEAAEKLGAALGADAAPELADAAYTLSVGRRPFAERAVAVADSAAEAARVLAGGAAAGLRRGRAVEEPPPVAFLFPGQGAQHLDMARELAAEHPVFAAELEACCAVLEPLIGLDLAALLLADEPRSDEERAAAEARLTGTEIAQPALFAVEWALAAQWRAWGIEPAALIGHSLGEYVAAALAGVFSRDDALALVAARGRLMASLPRGAMAAIEATYEVVAERLAELGGEVGELEIAAVNGPADVVVSGPEPAIEALLERLAGDEGPRARRLHTSHAFHSAMMEPILDAFEREVAGVARSRPAIPFVSNRTGGWIGAERATSPSYWREHLRHEVRFAAGLRTLAAGAPGDEREPLLLEVGPGRSLAALARRQVPAERVIASQPHPHDPRPPAAALLDALGRLWVEGCEVSWQGYWAGQTRRRVPLPGYAFERRRYWLEPRARRLEAADTLERIADAGRWLSVPTWRQGPPLPAGDPAPRGRWLVFSRAESEAGPSVGAELAALLARAGDEAEVIEVIAGERYARDGATITLDPELPGDYERLFAELAAAGALPERVVHAWGCGARPVDLERAELDGFHSLLWIARGLELAGAPPVRLDVVTAGAERVTGGEPLIPERALAAGPVKVLPQEHPSLECAALDLDLAELAADGARALAHDLLAALVSRRPAAPFAALRRGALWLREHAAQPLPPLADAEALPVRLREGGVYLITGGLGGLGLAVAKALVERASARLVLLGRRELPPRERWAEAAERAPDGVVAALLELEAAGAEVLPLAADVTDEPALAAAVARAERHFGPLHGVFHCAGVAGGGVAQLKSVDAARRVLAPKVAGTLALDAVLGSQPLDFCLLFSSVNAVIGGFGQSDYAAANAFLDAFARTRYRRRGTYWAAIAWDRWEEVGMAARSSSPLSLAGDAAAPAAGAEHPLLGVAVWESDERAVFVQQMSAETHWELAEHHIAGHPTLPGTTYLEMARAAFRRVARRDGAVELSEVAFLAPLVTPEGGVRQVVLTLERDGGERWSFRVTSTEPGAPLPGSGELPEGAWLEHARGEIAAAAEDASPALVEIEGLRDRCSRREITLEEGEARRAAADFLATGLRWESLRGLELGDGEGLARLELPAAAAADLERYVLHPALLDAAAGAVQFLGEGNFLPLSYRSLIVHRALPARGYGWLRLRGDGDGDAEILSCDLTVLGEDGAAAVEVRGFAMRRVGDEALAQLRAGQAAAPASAPRAAEPAGDGIRPREGVEVLLRVLETAPGPNLVVTTRSLAALAARADALDRDALAEQLASSSARAAHGRPELATEYEEPEGDLERRIAAGWRRVLGVDRVGAHDNFFELGGTSLNAIQLAAELKAELGTEIPTVAIFEAPTVTALASYLAPREQEKVTDSARDRAQKKKRALRQARRGRRRR